MFEGIACWEVRHAPLIYSALVLASFLSSSVAAALLFRQVLTGGGRPFTNIDNIVQLARHQDKHCPHVLVIPVRAPDILKQILLRCWALEPTERPELSEIVAELLTFSPLVILGSLHRSCITVRPS